MTVHVNRRNIIIFAIGIIAILPLGR